MKRSCFPSRWLLAVIVLLGFGKLPAQDTLISETPTEFTAAADFDADGDLDAVIVDKATGQYRLGFSLTASTTTWESPRSSGLVNLTGFTTGVLLNREPGSIVVLPTNRTDVAFASPLGNRINLFNVTAGVPSPQPVTAYPVGVGPSLIVAADVGGAGNTTNHDLLTTSILNNGPLTSVAGLLRNVNDTFSATAVGPLPLPAPLSRGNRVTPRTNSGPTFVTVMSRQPGANQLQLLDLSAGNLLFKAGISPLPDGAEYTAGFFTNRAWLVFLAYVPGTSNGVAVYPLAEPAPGNFAFPPGPTLRFGFGSNVVEQVHVIRSSTKTGQLVVVLNGGREARVLDFDGLNPPALVETIVAAVTSPFTSLIGAGPGAFHLLGGPGGLSRTYQTHRWNGTSFAVVDSGTLPTLRRSAVGASLAQFRLEPFVVTQPFLLGLARVSDWASAPAFQNSGVGRIVRSVGEAFRDSQQGLGTPVPVDVPAIAGAAFALPSQYREAIAIATLNPAQGAIVSELLVSPPGGSYASGICVSLAATLPTDVIQFRLNGGAWTRYTAPVALYRSTTLEAYSEPTAGVLAGPRSALLSARYEITTPWSEVDSDGDGVPDFVEVNNGLNPKSGSDTDRDGFSDLDELLAGSNPSRTNSAPGTNHLKQTLTFPAQLGVTPQPHLIPLPGFGVAEGTPVSLRQLSGALIAEEPAVKNPATPPLLTRPTAEFEVQLASGGLLTVATPEHFETTPNRPLIGEPSGFELLAILPAPQTQVGAVPYIPTAQADSVQATTWIGAARQYLATNRPPRLENTLLPLDVLIAALFEHKVDSLLSSDVWKRSAPLTFFPHRSRDASRTNVPLTILKSLLSPANSNTWQLRNVLLQIDDLARGLTNRPILDLRLLTAEVYRVGSYSNITTLTNVLGGSESIVNGVTNVTGGTTNIVKVTQFPPLLDELRRLLETGTLSSNYSIPTLTPTLVASAAQGARDILNAVQARPRVQLELVVLPRSFDGECAVFGAAGGRTVALFDRFHQNFNLHSSFAALLLPGSRVRVTGFDDLAVPACADQALEVAQFILLDVPAPALGDTDSDGLGDEWERAFFGNLTAATGAGDNDGDGVSNRDEFRAGTDPANAASRQVVPPTPEDMAANGVPAEAVGGADAVEAESGDLVVETDGAAESGVELDAGAAEGLQAGVVDSGTNTPVALLRNAALAAGLPPKRLTMAVIGTQAGAGPKPLLTVRLDRSGTELLVTPDSTPQGARSNTFLLIGAQARLLTEVTLPQGIGLRLRDQFVTKSIRAAAPSKRAGAAPAGAGENAVRFAVNFGSSLMEGFTRFTGNLAGAFLEGLEAADETANSDSGTDCGDPGECGGDTGGDTGSGSGQSTANRIADLPGGSISNVVTVIIVPTDATVGTTAINRLRLSTPDAASFHVRKAGLISDGFVYGASGGARIRGSTGVNGSFEFATRPPRAGSLAASRAAAWAATAQTTSKASQRGTARLQAGVGEDIPGFQAGLTVQRGVGTDAVAEQVEARRTGPAGAKWEGPDFDAVMEAKVPDLQFNPKEVGIERLVHRLDGFTRTLPVSDHLVLSAKGGGEVAMEELSLNFDTRRVVITARDAEGAETGRHVLVGDQLGTFRGGNALIGLQAPVPLAGHLVPALERILQFEGTVVFQPAGGGASSTGKVFIVRSELRLPVIFPFRPVAGLSFATALNRTNDFRGMPRLDWGDATQPSYPTLANRNGARHSIVRGLRLGRRVDAELNGSPNPLALGDDLLGGDDEDGVALNSALLPGSAGSLSVRVRSTAGPARLDAFVDFNADGDWADAGEKIFNSLIVSNGVNLLTFAVPAAASRTNTFARFRLSRAGGLGPDGSAPDGEVEDYRVRIGAAAPVPRLTGLEFDADGRPVVKLGTTPGADGIVTLESVPNLGATEWTPESQPTAAGAVSSGLEGQIKGGPSRFFRVRQD